MNVLQIRIRTVDQRAVAPAGDDETFVVLLPLLAVIVIVAAEFNAAPLLGYTDRDLFIAFLIDRLKQVLHISVSHKIVPLRKRILHRRLKINTCCFLRFFEVHCLRPGIDHAYHFLRGAPGGRLGRGFCLCLGFRLGSLFGTASRAGSPAGRQSEHTKSQKNSDPFSIIINTHHKYLRCSIEIIKIKLIYAIYDAFPHGF